MSMTSKKGIRDYKVGEELWRHVEGGGTFRYLVTGIPSYEDSTQLEVECQTCSHGWKCRVLLVQNDYGRIVSAHLLNDDEEDSQRSWHCNEGLHYWPTKSEAREEGLQMIVRRVKERITNIETDLKRQRDYLSQLEAAIGESANATQQRNATGGEG